MGLVHVGNRFLAGLTVEPFLQSFQIGYVFFTESASRKEGTQNHFTISQMHAREDVWAKLAFQQLDEACTSL